MKNELFFSFVFPKLWIQKEAHERKRSKKRKNSSSWFYERPYQNPNTPPVLKGREAKKEKKKTGEGIPFLFLHSVCLNEFPVISETHYFEEGEFPGRTVEFPMFPDLVFIFSFSIFFSFFLPFYPDCARMSCG